MNNQHTYVSIFASYTSSDTDRSLQKSYHLSHSGKIESKETPHLKCEAFTNTIKATDYLSK